jgi:DNA mismatch repair protein MutS2
VLLDELGAGTDPQEGAALGIGLLRFLLQSGAKLAVTTHFSPLKHFAYKHPLLKTCSVDFDVETLSPTYRIVEGVGSSNAFEVAGKLGLPEEIIQSAKSVLSTGELKAEEIIQDLQRERNSLMESKNRLEAKRLEYESRLKELKEDHKRFLSEELSSVEELLKSTKASLKGALHKAHKEEKDKEALRRELSKVLKLSKGLKEAKQKLYDLPSLSLESLHKGERVLLKETRKVGVIKEIIDSERIEIDVGGLRVWAGLCDLAPPPPETKEDYSSYSFIPTSTPKLDLNVRGMTSFDAIREVELYIDRLMMSGISRGYIIHGKGSGKLRSEIRKHLEKNPHVKSFHSPPPHEGGEGITVVELGE